MRHKNRLPDDYFQDDSIPAVDAKFEAQKIAFGPFAFQASRCLRDLGILALLDEAGEKGISAEILKSRLFLSDYHFNILLEMGLSMGVIKQVVNKASCSTHYSLGKIGFYILHDEITIANMDFMHHVCYQGAFYLDDAISEGKPKGLEVFGKWSTIYEGLSSLPEKVRESWFHFDHYYSDRAFPGALAYVFSQPCKKMLDIGGNTGKWALACMEYNKNVQVTIIDLPGQTEVAKQKIQQSGYAERINLYEINILEYTSTLPSNFDVVWMSQFLDCFALEEITRIIEKIYLVAPDSSRIYVMEPLWDQQSYPAAVYSLHATSLYFTTMANGNSKMYAYGELVEAIERGGYQLVDVKHRIGPNDYSILQFVKDSP